MKVVLAGGSGFLGSALSAALMREGHAVTLLTRGASRDAAAPGTPSRVQWNPDGTSGPWARVIDGADAVVNLAGEPMDKRWTAERKRRILESRVRATRSVVEAIRASARAPLVLANASGIGFYLDSEAIVDESSPGGSTFVARICKEWEAEARNAETAGTRVVLLRSGVVLHRDGGALAAMLPPFRLGVGGPLGSGAQWWAWIHRDDWVRMTLWAIETPAVHGALNVCAPDPARNRDIARALGRALRRPSFIPAPGFALNILLGEMAGEMLLTSQRAVPRRARDGGFAWRFPELNAAVSDAVKRPSARR